MYMYYYRHVHVHVSMDLLQLLVEFVNWEDEHSSLSHRKPFHFVLGVTQAPQVDGVGKRLHDMCLHVLEGLGLSSTHLRKQLVDEGL